jgi:hypothetical protein
MAIFGKSKQIKAGKKYSAMPITLAHDEILTNGFLRIERGTL